MRQHGRHFQWDGSCRECPGLVSSVGLELILSSHEPMPCNDRADAISMGGRESARHGRG
jgi:hypothetical protein